jgi:hypothetical protein
VPVIGRRHHYVIDLEIWEDERPSMIRRGKWPFYLLSQADQILRAARDALNKAG